MRTDRRKDKAVGRSDVDGIEVMAAPEKGRWKGKVNGLWGLFKGSLARSNRGFPGNRIAGVESTSMRSLLECGIYFSDGAPVLYGHFFILTIIPTLFLTSSNMSTAGCFNQPP